jgi:hypothetical protein
MRSRKNFIELMNEAEHLFGKTEVELKNQLTDKNLVSTIDSSSKLFADEQFEYTFNKGKLVSVKLVDLNYSVKFNNLNEKPIAIMNIKLIQLVRWINHNNIYLQYFQGQSKYEKHMCWMVLNGFCHVYFDIELERVNSVYFDRSKKYL